MVVNNGFSKELQEWLVWELYNVHLKEGAPESVKKEFVAKFKQPDITIKK